MATSKGLAARAVLELMDGRKTYVEVRDNSIFVKFYTVYAIRGRRWARECKVYPSHPRTYANSIEDAATKMANHFSKFGNAKVKKTTVKIYCKKPYKKWFKIGPDEMGLAVYAHRSFQPIEPLQIFSPGSQKLHSFESGFSFSTRRSIDTMETTPTTFYFPSDLNLFLGSAKCKNEQVLL